MERVDDVFIRLFIDGSKIREVAKIYKDKANVLEIKHLPKTYKQGYKAG
jgi:hypothetical protein